MAPHVVAEGNGAAVELKRNPALLVSADHNIRMEEAPVRQPGPGEALIHVRATGICGSDIHFWKHGQIGDLVVAGDCILGHEPAGEVIQLGEGVRGLKVGDRVAVEPGVPCGKCFLCAAGRYNLCEQVKFVGVYPDDGTIQRYKVHPAEYLHKIPSNMSYGTAALLEPLCVALHALRTCPVSVGTAVAVFGAGPIGLLTMAVARASGAYPLVITDTDASRLEFAKHFEPNCTTYQVALDKTPEENAKAIRALYEGTSSKAEIAYDVPQLVLECTGIESSIATAGYTVRRGGTVNVVGVSAKQLINGIPFMHMSMSEVQLRFINRYNDSWPAAIRAVAGNLIPHEKLEQLITHRFPLTEAVKAMELVGGVTKRKEGEIMIKVQIVDDDDNDNE